MKNLILFLLLSYSITIHGQQECESKIDSLASKFMSYFETDTVYIEREGVYYDECLFTSNDLEKEIESGMYPKFVKVKKCLTRRYKLLFQIDSCIHHFMSDSNYIYIINTVSTGTIYFNISVREHQIKDLEFQAIVDSIDHARGIDTTHVKHEAIKEHLFKYYFYYWYVLYKFKGMNYLKDKKVFCIPPSYMWKKEKLPERKLFNPQLPR